MRQLWIHAGFPKNGSSAIQVFLAKNRDRLIKEGMDYLEIDDLSDAKKGKITSGNGAKLSRSLLGAGHEAYLKDGQEHYDKFIDALAKCESANAIISSEYFPFAERKNVEKLISDADRFGFKVRLLFYVRRQDQFLVSSYMQEVKRHGYTGPLEEFVESKYKSIHFLNYYGFSRQLSEVIGSNNLNAFRYDLTKNDKNGIVGHFMKVVLGRCPEWVKAEGAVNTSPAPSELKLMLLANRFQPRMKFSDLLVEDSQRVGRSSFYPTHNI